MSQLEEKKLDLKINKNKMTIIAFCYIKRKHN